MKTPNPLTDQPALEPGELIQRETELSTIQAAVRAAADGGGGVIHVEAAAGLGKTRLLDATADAGRRASGLVLRAGGRAAERGYRFGVAVQLFEPCWHALPVNDREELERGPARAVAQLMAGDHGGAEEFAIVRGLLWLARSLANAGAPLVLVVDDLDRAADPSLAAPPSLSGRVDALPILLATAGRVLSSAADPPALAALRHHATILRPSPLSPESVGALVSAACPGADARLRAAGGDLSAGNPQLLSGLLDDLRHREDPPPPEALTDRMSDS